MDPTQPWMLGLIALLSFLLSFIGAAVGLVLGHLRLPLLVAYLASPPAGAACNLLVSGVGALAGTANHLRNGRVSWSVLALMGLPSVTGAVIAAYLFANHVSAFWSHVVIGVMLVVSGVNLVRSGKKVEAPEGPARGPNVPLEVVIGLALGALAAVTGLMLGSLRLPMMIRWLRIDPRVAVGSNMAIGCLTGLVGAATTFLTATGLPWREIGAAIAILAPPTVLGGWLGGWLTGRLKKETVQRLAGWIIGVTGVWMVGQGLVPELRKSAHVPALLDEEYHEQPFEWFDADDD
jgi:uncharacterized membrane protein YfcA